jgi:hypothetical protein
MYCSPIREKSYEKHKTCFSKRQLIHMAKELKIPYSNLNKMDLWKNINNKMLNYCASKDEICWIENVSTIDTQISHKPKQPKHYNNWLSNIDIINVMKQYEDKYPSFKFIGALPIDFNSRVSPFSSTCISDELCNIDFKKIKQYQFGIVFNLDKHDEPGSHWVCVYLNTNKNHKNHGFYYFDSNGDSMPTEIHKFAQNTKQNIKENSFEIHSSTIRKQFSNSECGMFCLYFIVKMLMGTSYKKLIHSEFSDKDMIQLRKKVFI